VESEVSRVQLSHDPRSQHDDPLLDSLLSLCVLHQKPASRVMLTTGLPLPAQRLSPSCCPAPQPGQACRGACCSASWSRSRASPCRPCCCSRRPQRRPARLGNDDTARLLLSESDGGEVHVSREACKRLQRPRVLRAAAAQVRCQPRQPHPTREVVVPRHPAAQQVAVSTLSPPAW
jgi:ATP-binding cassette subfamily C protein LapB